MAIQILVIDDSSEDIDLLTLKLRESGLAFTPIACQDSEQASAMVKNCSPDSKPHLIVLDLHLPPDDGEAVFRTIRANPHLQQTPVLIMTTSASPEELNRFRSHPFTDVATKPYSLKEYGPIIEIITKRVSHAQK